MSEEEDGPVGTWTQRWLPFMCKHDLIRCVHGDEIIYRNFRRRACVICGRSLRGSLPEPCSVTGRTHGSLPRPGHGDPGTDTKGPRG